MPPGTSLSSQQQEEQRSVTARKLPPMLVRNPHHEVQGAERRLRSAGRAAPSWPRADFAVLPSRLAREQTTHEGKPFVPSHATG